MEKSKNQKQSFLSGAAWLAASTIIVKVIGALYKIPLSNVIGDAGFSYFSTAYQIYAVLLMISTAGLPVAMSRMIAEAESRGNYVQLRRIYKTCLGIFVFLGVAGTVLMCGFAKPLAAYVGQPNAWYAIFALGPASLLMCPTSAYRGFFQGQGNMRPTSISQVLEAVFKLVAGLALAWFIMATSKDIPMASGGAILGVTISSLAATIYMAACYHRSARTLPQGGGEASSYGTTAKKLLAVAVPITIGAAGLQIIALIDQSLNMHRLLGPCGYSQENADSLKGIYDFTLTIFNLPCALVTPVTVSIIPAITAQITKKDSLAVKATEESGMRVLGLMTMPCAVGLFVLSQPIMALLRGYTGESLAIAGQLLSVLGISVVFNSTVLLTNAIMQAHGHPTLPVLNMFVGGLVKIVVNYILVGNPAINIQGAPIGTLCCYLSITVLNAFAMRKVVKDTPAMTKNLCRPLVAALAMGVACFLAWQGLARVTERALILCAVPIAVGALVYAFLVVKMKIITKEDCLLLPKGEKLAKILKVE